MFRPHIIVIPLILATGLLAVTIHDVKVPSTYILDEDNDEPLILDCIYDVDPQETGFVLKWLLNDRPVYQWIPSVGSFALPLLKNRIDASYEVSQESHQKHRALAIVKPAWNVTGNYTCSVQTFQSSDRKSAHLQIVVPERNFHLKHHCCDGDDTVDIICNTSGIYPEPKLNVLLNDDIVSSQVTHQFRSADDGLYEVVVSARVPRQRMESPTTIKCTLTVPGTSYSRIKESIFYDRLTFVPTAMPLDEGTSATLHYGGAYGGGSANRASIVAGIILPILLLHLT